MEGSPLKRQCKLDVPNGDGSVISFPRMLRVAELPPRPEPVSAAEKIEHLLGISLDRARAISFHARRPSSIRTD